VTTKLNVKVLSYPLYTLSSLPSGTPILTAGGKTDFTDKVTIENKDGTNPLKAYKYDKEIRAEYPSALTLNGTPYPNLEKAFEKLTENAPNTIVLYTDLAPDKFTLPTKKINKLTIDGQTHTLTLPKVTSLAPAYDLALENINIVSAGAASLTITAKENVNLNSVTFEPVPTISLAANKSLSIKGTTGLINKVSGTATSDLYVYDSVKMNEIANVGTVWTDPSNAFIRVYGKVSGVDVFSGHLRMSSLDKADSVTIKEVQGNSTLRLMHKDNVITKATITDITGTLGITVQEPEGAIKSVIPSGFPILTAGGNTDLSGKITLGNTDPDGHTLKAYQYGKEIRAEYDEAVSLTIPSVGTFTSSDFNWIFEVIKNRPDSADSIYDITVNTDGYAGKFTLPAKAKSIRFIGTGTPKTITMVGTSSLAPKYDVTFKNIKLENINANGVPTAFSISQSTGTLTLESFSSDTLSGITGTGNSKLELIGVTPIDKISGFNAITVTNNFTVGKTFSTNMLTLYMGSTITVPEGCSITTTSITGGSGAAIKLEPGFKPLTINGTSQTSINGTVKLVSDSPIEDDVQILNSAGCPLGNFDVTGIKGGSTDYCLTRTGSKVYCKKAVFKMDGVKYATFADIVAEIERVKDPTAVYEVNQYSDYDAGGALKFPKAGTYAGIAIVGNYHTLSFTGNLSLTGVLGLKEVKVDSRTSAGASANYTITITGTGGGLESISTNFHNVTAITAANQFIGLNAPMFDKPVKITTKDFVFQSVTGIIDTLTVDTIESTGLTDLSRTLDMLEKKQSKVNVGITNASGKIIFHYVKADGTDAPLVVGTVLFTVFKGDWNYGTSSFTHNVWTDPFGANRDPNTFKVTARLH
ncbi:MAG: hypothetical protein J6X60_05190, partial [Ruminiclostridium sp.]|nr:hypothetical protein [Ruminiclostridium sp.]